MRAVVSLALRSLARCAPENLQYPPRVHAKTEQIVWLFEGDGFLPGKRQPLRGSRARRLSSSHVWEKKQGVKAANQI